MTWTQTFLITATYFVLSDKYHMELFNGVKNSSDSFALNSLIIRRFSNFFVIRHKKMKNTSIFIYSRAHVALFKLFSNLDGHMGEIQNDR